MREEPTVLFASFGDLPAALAAVHALVDAGVPPAEISVASKSADGQPGRKDLDLGAMAATFPDLRASGAGGTSGDLAQGGFAFKMAGLASSANASVEPGEMTDYLWDLLPAELAQYYRHHYDGGRAVVIVHDPRESVDEVLREKGALKVQRAAFVS